MKISKEDKKRIELSRKYGLRPDKFKCSMFLLFEEGYSSSEAIFLMKDAEIEPGDKTLRNTIRKYHYLWKRLQK